MSLKTFFKIGDANAEITRLTNELAAAKEAQKTAENARDAAIAEVTPSKEKITTLEGQVTTLTTERQTAITERDAARAELATAKETIAAKDTEISTLKGDKKTVEQRAAEIAAGVGSPAALGADPDPSKANGKEGNPWNRNFLARKA